MLHHGSCEPGRSRSDPPCGAKLHCPLPEFGEGIPATGYPTCACATGRSPQVARFQPVHNSIDMGIMGGFIRDDHVHLLVTYPPKLSLSRLVNSLKGVSSRRLRRVRPEITGRYRKGVLWSPSYFAASCGRAPLEIIRRYVEEQRTIGNPR